MTYLPRWVVEPLKKQGFKCMFCKSIFKEKGIISVGIRNSLKTKEEVIFVEYKCPEQNCGKHTDVEFEAMNLLEFATDILDDFEDEALDELEKDELKNLLALPENKRKKSKPVPKYKLNMSKSKITVKEVNDARKRLNNIRYHEEFLLELGFDASEFIKNNGERKNNDKKNK